MWWLGCLPAVVLFAGSEPPLVIAFREPFEPIVK